MRCPRSWKSGKGTGAASVGGCGALQSDSVQEANVALSKQTVEVLIGVVVETEVESPVEEQAEEKSA